jgi:transcriptional regulator with XRE-family HTH domain
MTQKDLADRFKVHQPSVSAWELGKALPSLATMLELAALFGIEATLADVAEWMAETTEAVEV